MSQVNSEALKKACPIPFHEGRLWKSADAADLKRQLQGHFRNMTSVMDCVGCEKCKMWGKLQLMGAQPPPPCSVVGTRHAQIGITFGMAQLSALVVFCLSQDLDI